MQTGGILRDWQTATWVLPLAATIAIAWAEPSPAETHYVNGPKIHRSPPPAGATTHTVIPGERFAAGWLHRAILGGDYRDLWLTPLEVPVLDLDVVGGGLTPLRTGGFGQSVSLHFEGQDGKRYTVRSLDKDPTKRIDEMFEETFVEGFLLDQISSLLPCAGLVADPLMEATGVLHAKHTLVVIPNDPGLGEFRSEFAGLIGTLQVHPSEGPDGTPGFAGSTKISGSDVVFERLEKRHGERLDARSFLKARLIDFLLNDKDRHPGQWRWARFPEGEGHVWVPIPEDRDQAFIEYDGLSMVLARMAVPQQIKFQKDFPNLAGLSISGWEIDRFVLAGLELPVWSEVAQEVRRELTDPVIEDAVRRLPLPYYERVGAHLTEALKARRDELPAYAEKYYRLISKAVEIKTTDENELAILEHDAAGRLRVNVTRVDASGAPAAAPIFTRTFDPSETDEVRLYLQGGADRTEVRGAKGKITVRVDGGGGADTYGNSSATPASKVRFYDARGTNRFAEGGSARIDEHPFSRPPGKEINHEHALDWGKKAYGVPYIMANPDQGVLIGYMRGSERYGYRKVPFASHHSLHAGVASEGPEPVIGYRGLFREVWGSLDGEIQLQYSGIEVRRFNGLGNETEIPGSEDFYEVQQKQLVFAPEFSYRSGPNRATKTETGEAAVRSTKRFSLGPIFQYVETPEEDNEDRYIGSLAEPVYGAGSFGQIGARIAFSYDTRDVTGNPKRGFHLATGGAIFPALWDVDEPFGSLRGSASTYLTAPILTSPTLALRIGGSRVFGTYPFHEAAYLGGAADLRGYWKQRFGGDAAAYGSAELRFEVAKVRVLLPGVLGLFAATDAGRVFLEDDPGDSDKWHASIGGGVWISFMHHRRAASLAVMNGDDMTGVYLRIGLQY